MCKAYLVSKHDRLVSMRIRKLNHSVYQVQYHLVWGTKYRRKFLKYYVKTELIKALYQTQRRHPAIYIHNVNTGDDHVHMQIEIPPTYPIPAIIRDMKTYSSAHLRKRFPFINRMYIDSGIWGTGYFISTIGLNEANICKYIDNQNTDDRGSDVTSEFS